MGEPVINEWPAKLAAATDRKAAYAEYLLSDVWQGKRTAALERAGNRCQLCNGTKILNVHHRTYERIGAEAPEDLTVLCRSCHAKFHDVGKPKKKRRYDSRKGRSRRPPKQNKNAYVPKRPCSSCGYNWTTKGMCKPCRKRRKKGLPPAKRINVTQDDIDRFADALNKKWQPTAMTRNQPPTRAERMRGQWQT